MLKNFYERSKGLLVGAALCAAVATPMLAPKPAEAWWGPGWGWHGGFVVAPPVVVGPVVPAPVGYPYPYPYAAPYAYAAPGWHWVPTYRNAAGMLVEGHWEHN